MRPGRVSLLVCHCTLFLAELKCRGNIVAVQATEEHGLEGISIGKNDRDAIENIMDDALGADGL